MHAQGALFTGRHMLIVMVMFFGVIFIANGFMVYFASQSWTGLVVKNGYVASQAFNRKVDRQNKLLADGWRGALEIKNGHYNFVLSKGAEHIRDCAVMGVFRRPVHNKNDQTLRFKADTAGVYRTQLDLAPGVWTLTLKALCPGESQPFQQNYRFHIQAANQTR